MLPEYVGESDGTAEVSLRFDGHDHGSLVVFVPPADGAEYVVGADVAEESSEGDFSCAQVLRHDTLEQVAIWHGHIAPRRFALELADLGYFFNTAYMVCEFNGCGAVTCVSLQNDLVYPKMYWREPFDRMVGSVSVERPGFLTSSRTKKFVLDGLANSLWDVAHDDGHHGLRLHDEETVRELLAYEHNYTRYGASAYGAPPGKHDDRVMALALAVEGCRQFQPVTTTTDRPDWSHIPQVRTTRDIEDEDSVNDPEAMLRWCHR